MRFARLGVAIGALALVVGLSTITSAQTQTILGSTYANAPALQATATPTTAATAATTVPTSVATAVPTRVATPVPTRTAGTLPQTSGSDARMLPFLAALALLLLISSLRALLRPKRS